MGHSRRSSSRLENGEGIKTFRSNRRRCSVKPVTSSWRTEFYRLNETSSMSEMRSSSRPLSRCTSSLQIDPIDGDQAMYRDLSLPSCVLCHRHLGKHSVKSKCA